MATVQTHNFGATYQEGIITALDPKTHKVRCKIPALDDLETAWLSFLTPNAGGNQFYCLPDVGELVALLLDHQGEGGCVLGTIYNEQDSTPVADSEMWVKKFRNGTIISHHRASGEITVKTSGTVNVTAGKVNITAPCEITGDVKINGNLQTSGNVSAGGTVNAPTVSSNGVTLATHTHSGVESGNKRTGSPA